MAGEENCDATLQCVHKPSSHKVAHAFPSRLLKVVTSENVPLEGSWEGLMTVLLSHVTVR